MSVKLTAFSIISTAMNITSALRRSNTPTAPNLEGWIHTILGGGIMAALMLARHHLLWWPLHPIGLAVNCTYFTQKTFFALFVVWGIKVVLLKVGGVDLYRRGRPFFIGILVGYVLAVAVSTVIDYFYFFGEGHYVHAV